MPWWGWIVLGVVLLLAEIIAATDFYLVFFAAGALIVGLLAWSGVELPVAGEWILFATFSVVTLLMFRARLREKIRTREHEVDHLEGEIALASGPIAAGATGRAELRGSVWSVVNAGDTAIAEGDRCRVERVEGLVLSIRKDG